MLKVYQDHKQPEYTYEQNRQQLIRSGILKPSPSMIDRSSLTVQESPDALKRKQVRYVKRLSNLEKWHVCSVAHSLLIPKNIDKIVHIWKIECF